MTDLTDDTRLIRNNQAADSRLGQETVILHLESGLYFGLDPVGSRIWEILADGATPAAIRDRLLTEFEVAPEVLETDIRVFLANMISHDIIRPAP